MQKKNHILDDEISMSGVGFKNDWVTYNLEEEEKIGVQVAI